MKRFRTHAVSRKGRFFDAYVGVNFWPISRFHLTHEWWDNTDYGLGVSWGTPGCDPVWTVDFTLHIPVWLQRLFGASA